MDGDEDEREQRLRKRAHALADLPATRRRYLLRCIELLSGGEVVLEVTGRVRRHVIVHRDLRSAMRQCILRNGWDFAVTRIPPGAKSNEFERLSGWDLVWTKARLEVPVNTLNSWAREVRTFNSTIRDVAMLKGKHGLTGQDRRLATKTGARLNDENITRAEPHDAPSKLKRRIRAYDRPPDFGLESSGATWKPDDIEPPQLTDQSWGAVCDHPDIAAADKRETDEYDAIARALHDGVVTDKERIASLNERHRAMLAAIVGNSTYVPPPTISHYAADTGIQTAALDMVFTDVGIGIEDRRDRYNNILEPTEKLNKYGKRYRPGKAGPCRTLTGEALIAAIAALRPAKKHGKRYPRSDKPCLFDKCRRARKQPIDYMARSGLFEDDKMYRQWDKIAA